MALMKKTLRIVFCAFSLLVKMLKIQMKWKNDGFFWGKYQYPQILFFHFAQNKGWIPGVDVILKKLLLPVWGSSPVAFGEVDDVASIFLPKQISEKKILE